MSVFYVKMPSSLRDVLATIQSALCDGFSGHLNPGPYGDLSYATWYVPTDQRTNSWRGGDAERGQWRVRPSAEGRGRASGSVARTAHTCSVGRPVSIHDVRPSCRTRSYAHRGARDALTHAHTRGTRISRWAARALRSLVDTRKVVFLAHGTQTQLTAGSFFDFFPAPADRFFFSNPSPSSPRPGPTKPSGRRCRFPPRSRRYRSHHHHHHRRSISRIRWVKRMMMTTVRATTAADQDETREYNNYILLGTLTNVVPDSLSVFQGFFGGNRRSLRYQEVSFSPISSARYIRNYVWFSCFYEVSRVIFIRHVF